VPEGIKGKLTAKLVGKADPFQMESVKAEFTIE